MSHQRLPRRSARFGALVVIGLIAAAGAATAFGAPMQGTRNGQDGRLAEASWWDRTAPGRSGAPRSDHYQIRSDLSLDDTRLYAGHQDLMYREYMKRLGSLRLRTPPVLDVMMFAKRQDYLDTLRTRFGISGEGSGGMFFISPNGAALAYYTEGVSEARVKHVIQHEGFHQVAHAYFGSDLPPWLNEGLAEFFGEALVVGNDVVLGQSRPTVIGTVADAARQRKHIDFFDVLDMTGEQWNANLRSGDASLQYNQSWSMVHFLVLGDGGRYQQAFEGLLRLLNQGVPAIPAFEQAFGLNDPQDVHEFQERWRAFAQSMEPSPFAAAMERMEFLAEGMLALQGKGTKEQPWPTTLDELRERLREIDFEFDQAAHGYRRRLSSKSDLLFQIPGATPKDDPTAQPTAGFRIVPVDPSKANGKKRGSAEAVPAPPTIETFGVEPCDLRVEWGTTRDGLLAWRMVTGGRWSGKGK
ncbi:MAG: DUF1570 domain-containing protein [Planctomycetota bacterium]|nr:DUF1570 domain-containing protein [Planctomycetota bacterium]